MKKIALLCTILWCSFSLFSQTVAVVSYMKVPPAGGDAYIALEHEWKKVHQARVNEGKMIAWELYYVHNQGTSTPYNYATVNIYKDLKAALAGFSEAEFKKALGSKWQDILNKTPASRDLVKEEMYSYVMGIRAKAPEKYLTVSFMRILQPDNYYVMEEEAYMPMHQAAIDDKQMEGWGIWNRAFPEDVEYHAVAVNGYSSLDQLMGLTYADLQEKLKNKMKPSDLVKMVNLVNDTEQIRTMVKSQLWELVDATTSN